MKTIKTLSLLGFSTFTASQLLADITMTLDDSCRSCNEVEIKNPPGGYAKVQIQNGKHIVTFPSNAQEGTKVSPTNLFCGPKGCFDSGCHGPWQPAKDGGTLSCWPNHGVHKEVGKPHS